MLSIVATEEIFRIDKHVVRGNENKIVFLISFRKGKLRPRDLLSHRSKTDAQRSCGVVKIKYLDVEVTFV